VAGAELGALNLKVTSASEASNTEPVGKVTRTNPPANTSVASGSSVTIYVSSGPQPVPVPDERGQSVASAKAALEAAGFTVAIKPSGATGTVTQQNPVSGTAPKGSTVTITVTGGGGATTTTSPGATTSTT
jgi:serine/threonine-protein kinase